MSDSQEWLLLTAGTPPTFNAGYIPGNRGFGALTAADVSFATAGLSRLPCQFAYATFLGSLDSLMFLERHARREFVRTAKREGWRIHQSHRQVIGHMAALAVYESIAARSNRDFYSHDEERPSRGDASVQCPDCRGKGYAVRRGLHVRLFQRYLRRIAFAYHWWAAQPSDNLDRKENLRRVAAIRATATELLAEADADTGRKYDCELCHGSGVFALTGDWRAKLCHVSRSQWHALWKLRYQPVLEHLQRQEERAIRHVRRRLRHSEDD